MLPHLHFIFILSTVFLCRSSENFTPDNSDNSFAEPMTFLAPHLQFHIGNGIPQYLWRVTAQSGASSMVLWYLSLPKSGSQFVFLFALIIFSFIKSSFKNHCLLILNIKGVLHRQQSGYEWVILPTDNNFPWFSRSFIIVGSAFLTYMPTYFPASSVNRPFSSTGDRNGSP